MSKVSKWVCRKRQKKVEFHAEIQKRSHPSPSILDLASAFLDPKPTFSPLPPGKSSRRTGISSLVFNQLPIIKRKSYKFKMAGRDIWLPPSYWQPFFGRADETLWPHGSFSVFLSRWKKNSEKSRTFDFRGNRKCERRNSRQNSFPGRLLILKEWKKKKKDSQKWRKIKSLWHRMAHLIFS